MFHKLFPVRQICWFIFRWKARQTSSRSISPPSAEKVKQVSININKQQKSTGRLETIILRIKSEKYMT